MNRLSYTSNIFRNLIRGGAPMRMALLPMLMLAVLLLPSTTAAALPESTFSSASRMAEGKWARVSVESAGMHYISDASLKQMGFSDPSKVNVYGFGGRALSEFMTEGMPDDLPPAPAMRVSGGLVFFARDIFTWNSGTRLSHSINPYSLKSYYFLSDCKSPEPMATQRRDTETGLQDVNSFICYQVHEQELAAPAENGRDIMGEELRGGQSRNFSFPAPDNVGDKARVIIAYAANVRGGSSSIVVTANGTQLPATANDKLEGVTSSSGFLTLKKSQKDFDLDAEKLDLNIKYSSTGTFYGAWVDYIEFSYERALRLRSGELHFYLNPLADSNIELSGAGASTRIWDVTDPMHPVEIQYQLSGSTARFKAEKGLKEYVAFNPENIKLAPTDPVNIENQNIHGMEIPDYVIISPKEYISEAERLAEMRRRVDGMTVHVLTPEALYNEFSSGVPDPTAFRKAFKMWHERALAKGEQKLKYALLFSRPTFDNKMISPTVKQAGYPRIPQWLSTGVFIDDTAYGTDDYIGMMEDGEGFRMSRSKINIAVGRMAVTSSTEASQMVDKIIRYVEQPDLGAWRNSVLLISDDGDNNIHMTQSDAARKNMLSAGNGEDFVYERLYTDAFVRKPSGSGVSYPDAKSRIFKRLGEGVGFMHYVGHANPRAWTHENLLVWNDINSMTNTRLPFLAAYCCDFMRWDANSVSGAEKMWLYPSSGVIGIFCATRSVFMGPNGRLSSAFGKALYGKDDKTGLSKRLGDVMVEAKNTADNYDDNKLRFALLGDPAMKVLSPDMHVALDRIGDHDMTSGDMPELGAGSNIKVSGRVLNADGTLASDFDGLIEISLFDAEMPVTTNGWDSDPFSYNERVSRLGNVSARVKEGRWEASVHVPIEIGNNYSPALLNFYSYSSDGREANGSSSDFIVYGYDDSSLDDTTGPEIIRFVLNNDHFVDGAAVSPSPMVMAAFKDPSGINVSDTGIGHKMTLTLDGKINFDDINLYYSPDPDDSSAGSIIYPLNDLEPGHHTLELMVWDNAGNSSRASIDFQAAVGVNPTIYEINTDCSPAKTAVNFTVVTDRALSSLGCTIDVFDLNGRKVWSHSYDGPTDSSSSVKMGWDLRDNGGTRVPRGIYIYRATIVTPEGMKQTKSRKLAVAAQ